MNCLIIDDEPMAIKVIESHIANFEELKVIATCQNALEAFPVLQKEKIDILFLDIEMPKINGLSFLKSLKNPPLVLLTTAHRNYALEGFELDVVDYLLKPISLDRFIKAISKIYRLKNQSLAGLNNDNLSDSIPQTYIYVKSERENVKINLSEIQYIESLKNHIKIATTNTSYITLVSISETAKKLPSTSFVRIHRSFIINIHQINSFTNSYVTIGRKSIPIGNVYKSMVLELLNQNRI